MPQPVTAYTVEENRKIYRMTLQPETLNGSSKHGIPELLKKRAAHIRWKGINHSDKYLIEFESNFTRRGGKVSWALNGKEALALLKDLLKRENHQQISVDLKRSWKAFNGQSEISLCGPETAQALLTDALYLIADPGLVCTSGIASHNPNNLYVLATPDQILASLMNLETLIPLHHHLLTSARFSILSRGVHVIIIENQVTEWMRTGSHRPLLHCIDCRLCSDDNNNRMIDRIKEHIPERTGENMTDCYSLPLDGKATASCPVKINFEKLTLLNRQICIHRNYIPNSERWFYFFWLKAIAKRRKISLPAVRSFDYYVNALFNKSESKLREPLAPAPKSFNRIWREKKGIE